MSMDEPLERYYVLVHEKGPYTATDRHSVAGCENFCLFAMKTVGSVFCVPATGMGQHVTSITTCLFI